jgi:fluoroacetyl-CoA thioesterase
MKDSLAPGLTHRMQVVTTPEMGVSHLGAGPSVLSTPSMIGLMELCCLKSAQPHLDENEQTVGTMVHVWHRAGTRIGKEVTVSCKLLERDRRKLLYEVKVDAGSERIGDGTHERFVIDLNKFNK